MNIEFWNEKLITNLYDIPLRELKCEESLNEFIYLNPCNLNIFDKFSGKTNNRNWGNCI